jgi:hypothetical protein
MVEKRKKIYKGKYIKTKNNVYKDEANYTIASTFIIKTDELIPITFISINKFSKIPKYDNSTKERYVKTKERCINANVKKPNRTKINIPIIFTKNP